MTLANLKTRTASTSSVSSTSVSGSALTHAELDSNLINLRDSSWGLASDDSTVVQVSDDKTIKIAGGTNITTALSGDTLTITGAAAPITALNNKTANRLTTIGSTTTELDGEANLTFDGSTLAATGAITATTDITATGTIGNDAVSITDNVISTSRSNDTLRLEANGTGYINLGNADITVQTSNPRSQNGVLRIYDQGSEFDFSAQDSSSERKYTHTTLTKVKSNGTDSSNSNNRWRNAYDILDIDVNGALLTGSRPDLIAYFGNVYAFGNSSQLDIDNALGMEIRHFNEASSGQTINLTNAIGFQFRGVSNDGSGTNNSVNEICVDYQAGDATNKIFLQTDTDTALSNVGTLNKYRESINALTNSSTITVDCSLAPVHTCTIQQATGFNFKNLGTGQTATVIVKQDGTGGRTATFTEEDSTAIKFQGGAPTLSTGANAIDVITVFNTGSEVLGNCAKAYA